MKTIGITGGVGAGKSLILEYLEKHYNCRVLFADRVAHIVKEPGQACYSRLVELLGKDVLCSDGTIDKRKMAEIIFSDEALLKKVNTLIHPAVEAYIMEQIRLEKDKGELDFFFVEAALLIECGYDKRLDEIWYIFADQKVRRARLKETRGYSDEKIDGIMSSQLSEEAFRAHCKQVIDNSGSPEQTYKQIDQILRG